MSIFKHSDLVFENITDDIVHVKAKDYKILASTMVRFQEHYESQMPEIRGKIFTLGQLRAAGTIKNRKGVYTYEGGNKHDTDWSGYNWPSFVLEPFIRGLFDPLTEYEQDLVNALKCKPGKFYVIGTYGEEDPGGAIDHEICHALYYVNLAYKTDVDKVMVKYRKQLEPLEKCLSSWGYCDEVLWDECHAYMSADYDWFFENKEKDVEKFGIKIDRKLHEALRKVKNKYWKEDGNK